jgi:HEPN domain-containing protein
MNFMHMNIITFKDAQKASDAIVKTLNPISVILFGSLAREGTGNDMDLLVITGDEEGDGEDKNILLHKCLKKFYRHFSIDSFIVSLPALHKYYSEGSPFLNLIFKEGRTLYMKDAVREWMRQSEEELNIAVYLSEGCYFKGACFHAQQSIEKSIKTLLIHKGWDLEKIHSISRLIAIGKDYKIKLTLSDEEIVFIDGIYRGRYPAEAGLLPLGAPLKADADRAVNIAKRIFGNVKTALKTLKR